MRCRRFLPARVANPEQGFNWSLLLDTLQSQGLQLREQPCTEQFLTDAVEPVLVRLKEGGCAVVLPAYDWDRPQVLWPMRGMKPQEWPLDALARSVSLSVTF